MKGKIINVWKTKPFGFIMGDDGVSYHFNFNEFTNRSGGFKVGWLVEFEPSAQEDGEHCGEPEAINIRKIGHGKHHPLALDIRQIGEYLLKYVPDDDPAKAYLLRNADTIYNYFCTVADSELYPNPREFFRSGKEKVVEGGEE